MTLTPETRLGPYEITGALGAGGMGEVNKARDTRLDRTVAIKVLPGVLASDPSFRARFEREARSISALNHPHICTLHDVGQEGSIAFLVMEYVDGRPPAGPMPPETAIPIVLQICDALAAAHRAGIVHRDLKPSNILLTGKTGTTSRAGTPHVKLLDFGLATRAAQPQSSASIEATVTGALTGAHSIIGTPQYMAPEQIEGRESDARTDIFALGCVICELLTGQRAFEGKTASGVMAATWRWSRGRCASCSRSRRRHSSGSSGGASRRIRTIGGSRCAIFAPRWSECSRNGGRKEVYVTTFPELSGKWQVSITGGDHPRWRRDGKELFYLTADLMMSAEVNAAGSQFVVGVVRPLFDARWAPARSVYDVTGDGKRFLMVTWDPSPSDAGFKIVVNWLAALR